MFAKLFQKVRGFLTMGITPHKLALASAWGLCIGIIPLLGSTTVLSITLSLVLRINLAVNQLVCHLVYPLQLLLFIPYLKFGTTLLSDRKFNYTLADITSMITKDPWHAITTLFVVNMFGLLLWLLTCPFLFAGMYYGSKAAFARLERRKAGQRD
ncbi:DUF2062 domain-containing protein [Hufsiella ginkgonis]|uniref:DUF2062 domain-containing protein n=1 Tax=Hufsiella ginkgonis TaxID=2695274 RepID=A0A7K1XWY2_9SPHI|nr:DUF2062 domain-containing protein [Hufsiella ginkgonis]MXV15308.1 DUF2062 domain-containing protein [Hufsiella ginkgonis]